MTLLTPLVSCGWLAAVSAALMSGAVAVPVENGMRVLSEGAQSGVTERKRVVIRSQEEWAKLWETHAGRARMKEPPKVDWSREMVLAAYMGQKPTSGFAVLIREPRTVDGKLVVTVAERTPGFNPALQVLTTPYQLAAVRRSDLPVEWKTEMITPPGRPPGGR